MAIEFSVDLKDGVSVPAGSAAHQMDVLGKSARGLQDAMLKANALGDAKAFNKASEQFGKLKSQMEALGPAAKAEIDALKAAKEASEQTVGVTEENITSTKSFGQAMSALGPEVKAVAIAVTAAVAAMVAFGYAVFETLKGISKLTESRRQLQSMFAALNNGVKGGADVMALLDKMSAKLPFTISEMGKWAQAMTDAGIRDLPTLESATKAAAASAAILGDQSGAAGQKIADLNVQIADAVRLKQGIGDLTTTLRGTGTSAEQVAGLMGITVKQLNAMAMSGKNLKAIGGYINESLIRNGKGALMNMSLTWDNLLKKAHENFADLFSGIADSPGLKAFLSAMQNLLLIFAKQTNSGAAMKVGVTSAFSKIFDVAAKVIVWMHVKILELATLGIRWYISLIPVLRTMKALWAEYKGGEKLQMVLTGIGVIVSALAKGLWNLARPFVYAFGIAVALATAVVGVIGVVSNASKKVFDKLGEWKDAALTAAADFITGLVDGIAKGAKKVVDAVKNMAGDAVTSFKGTLGISSPSKVMMQMGDHMSTGLAMGIADGSQDVAAAASGMGGVAADAVSGAPKASGGSSSSQVTIAAGAITVVAAAGQSAQEIAEEVLAALQERLALGQGLAA